MPQPVAFRPLRQGFTLIELMVTIAVLVIVLAVAVPSMSAFAANNQVAGAKSAFATTVALARTEAARSGRTVLIQAETGGSAGNEFGKGWAIHLDMDNSGTVNAGDEVLRRFEAPADNIKVSGTTPLAFQPTGYLVGGATLDYTVCRNDGSNAGYKISVTPSGIADVAAITSC